MRSKVILAISIILLFLACAWQSRYLGEMRRERMPEAYHGYSADVPPALNFIMAGLGGFRGLVSEILWFRANRLQEEGRYIELVQLSEWITMLDPHAAEAWVYNAWNMAYNVSVMMIRPEDRLRWLHNGISILRDDGLRYNPKSAKLYRELAWIYQNKIGMDIDSAHIAYKLDLARTMQPLLTAEGALNDNEENRAALRAMRLDPDRMLKMEQRYGDLDWRMGNTHALYWAAFSVELATPEQMLLCRRALYQPLMLLTLEGRFIGDIGQGVWKSAPAPLLALSAAEEMKQTLEDFPSRNTRTVYLSFLTRAITILKEHDLNEAAIQLAKELEINSTVTQPSAP